MAIVRFFFVSDPGVFPHPSNTISLDGSKPVSFNNIDFSKGYKVKTGKHTVSIDSPNGHWEGSNGAWALGSWAVTCQLDKNGYVEQISGAIVPQLPIFEIFAKKFPAD